MATDAQLKKNTGLRKILWGGAVVLVLVVGGILLFAPLKNGEKLREVTIAQSGDFFLYAPVYVADDAGFFARNGLRVNLVSTGGDEKTWAAVVSDNAQFGVSDPTFVVISGDRGKPGMVVASIVNGVPFWGITFNKSIKPLSSPKELAGYSVATFPSPSTAYTLQEEMFKEGGLKPDIRQGAFGTIIAMLKAGQADIGLELEPNVSQAVKDGAHVVYSLSKIYGNFAITGLTTTPQVIAKHPNLVQAVVCSIQEALNFIRSNPDSSLKILQNRFPEVSPQVAQAALSRVISDGIIPASCVTDSTAWSNAVQLRIHAGDIKHAAAMGDYVDNTFADEALKTCGKK